MKPPLVFTLVVALSTLFAARIDASSISATSLSPADDATDVEVAAVLVASFSEPIMTGSGNITILNLAKGTEIVIPVGDPRVTVSGPNLTVDPDADFEPAIDYAIQLDAGVVADLEGNPFEGILDPDITTWNFKILPDPSGWEIPTAAIAPARSGAVTIYTAESAGEPVTTSDFVHSFDSAPRLSGSHTPLSLGSNITMSAGHHLVIYNARFDDPDGMGPSRSSIQTNLNLDGRDLAAGWSQGYIRREDGQNETITAGGAIIDVAGDGDILQLQSFRSDTNSDESADVIREPGHTALQLIKLDDTWDYLSLAATGTTQAVAESNSAWTTVAYSQEIERDARSFGDTTNGVTLTRPGHYLVFANTSGLNPSGDSGVYPSGAFRQAMIQHLVLDGSEVVGSKTTVYLRGADSTQQGAATIGVIIESTTANQVLKVEVQLEETQAGFTLDGDRTSLTMVKLPDRADYIRLTDTSGDQNINGDTLLYDDEDSQVELDSAFSHSTTANPNRIGVTKGGDYLFLSSQFDRDDEVQRLFYNQGWRVNGTGGLAIHGQTGSYSRNVNSTDACGNWSGFITGLATGDFVETVTRQLGNSGVNPADELALQGVSLESLFGSDIFSVNFYAYGQSFGSQGEDHWIQEEWKQTVTLEPGESAGLGPWHSSDWENITVPWDPPQPQAPLEITSNRGSKAMFTLRDVRNGAPYYWQRTRDASTHADGNATLLDGHANGTGAPGDGSKIFDMEISEIPFDTYDVIIYLGVNEGQPGDGRGRIVFNGLGQDFTVVTTEPDGTFTEIVDSSTPGNYIVFSGLTEPSVSAQVWGIGDADDKAEWVHVGPAGFQIMEAQDDYTSWRQRHFPDDYQDESKRTSVWGDRADPDSDGTPNVLEFMTHRDPLVSDGNLGPQLGVVDGIVTLTYPHTTLTNHDVLVSVSWSTDLKPWTTGGILYKVVEDLGDYLMIEASMIMPAEDRVFMRLEALRTGGGP